MTTPVCDLTSPGQKTDFRAEEFCILVVDDDRIVRRLLSRSLARAGYQTLDACSAARALELASQESPDLILLDLRMPVMNGFECCKRLKEDHQTRNIPVVFLTSEHETSAMVQGLEVGAVDYLTKPADEAVLHARVRTHACLGRLTHRLAEEVEGRTASVNKLVTQLRALTAQMTLTEERELQRIANELRSPALRLLEKAQSLLDNGVAGMDDDSRTAESCRDALATLNVGIQALRGITFNLSPPGLEEHGLASALEWLVERTKERWRVPLVLQIEGDLKTIPEEPGTLLYRCTRELISNIARYSNPTAAVVSVARKPKVVELTVSDNGRGLSEIDVDDEGGEDGEDEAARGFGLFAIRQRLMRVGGIMQLKTDSHGTNVTLILPLTDGDAESDEEPQAS